MKAHMNQYMTQISQYIDGHRDEMLHFWKDLVNFQAGSRETDRIEALLRRTMGRLEEEGLDCRLIPSGGVPVLLATDGARRSGRPIFLCGHLDTVFPDGTYPEAPFTIQDGVARGPGVLDMKGGVAMMVYMIKALRHIGFDRCPIKLLLCGDEEISHDGTCAAQIIQQEAEGCQYAFNMEIGRMDRCLSVGRKGSLDCRVTVTGKSGHVGNDFLSGRNAIEEMAHKVLALQGLSRYDEGVVVSVDVISGGTVSNSIPDRCQIDVDARFSRAADLPVLKEQISQVCAVTHVDGTCTTVEFLNTMPVFERNDANLALLDRVNQVAEAYGFSPFGEAFPGGSSDTSYVAAAGVPAVCSCGVQGGGAHTLEEYAIVATLFERAKIFAAVIAQTG